MRRRSLSRAHKRITLAILRRPGSPCLDPNRAVLTNHRRRVAILIETDDSWGRRVVASIAAYARRAGWQLLIGPRDHQHRLRLPKRWTGDGVLVSIRDRLMVEHLRRAAIPAVDVSIMMPKTTWVARVATDDNARAQMAFEHLRERGLKHFACYTPAIGRYSIDRALAFQRVVEQAGYRCDLFSDADGKSGWEIDNESVTHWLEHLPKPVAVFAADPYPARHIAELCQWNEINVPDEVAILAGDEDELLCNVSSPELSSIQLACETIGEEAAKLLDRLMQGASVPKKPRLIAPLYVRPRHSTDVSSTNAPELMEILQFIMQHSQSNLCVADLLSNFSVSRRWLEQRFRDRLGRSPAHHIRQVRMEAVQRALIETDLSITQIAYQMGFSSSTGLTQQFKRHFRCSPTAMRNRG